MKRITIGKRRKKKGGRQLARALIRELPNLLRLIYRLMRDPRVPRLDKALFGAVALYLLTPMDLIPDFLGVLGWVDDFYLVGLALGRLMVSAGPDGLLRHWDGDPRTLGYLVEGVDELGAELPSRIRRGLQGIISKPSQLARRGRDDEERDAKPGRLRRFRRSRRLPRRIRVDEDARIHLEE
jgi:uncharacterized membrane protein YkvA (DUF1232 family)